MLAMGVHKARREEQRQVGQRWVVLVVSYGRLAVAHQEGGAEQQREVEFVLKRIEKTQQVRIRCHSTAVAHQEGGAEQQREVELVLNSIEKKQPVRIRRHSSVSIYEDEQALVSPQIKETVDAGVGRTKAVIIIGGG